MKRLTFLMVITIACIAQCAAVNKNDFYLTYAMGKAEDVNSLINELKTDNKQGAEKAYLGVLLMKKAGFEKSLKKKLDLFKEGHKLLETEITADPENAEYRFLRLTVQEKAPAILKYNRNIKEDKKMVIDAYPHLSTTVKTYIHRYCQYSKVLSVKDIEK